MSLEDAKDPCGRAAPEKGLGIRHRDDHSGFCTTSLRQAGHEIRQGDLAPRPFDHFELLEDLLPGACEGMSTQRDHDMMVTQY